MRVVVTGATGNVGTSVLDALCADPAVSSVVGIARRIPVGETRWGARVEWRGLDVSADDLTPVFAGADAVVHLAWLIQPSRQPEVLRATNVAGSERVFRAVVDARVPALVHASSVGAYSPGPKDRAVDEAWPTNGIDSSFYARHKAAVERLLDELESERPDLRVVRLRPGLIFKREAASSIRRLFLGPMIPSPLLRPSRIPVVPRTDRLVFQAVHTDDVADAYRRAVLGDVRGPFNVAADPVLEPAELGRVLGARPVPVPAAALRFATGVSWRLHLQPTPSGWVDMAIAVPVLDTARARSQLGWAPRTPSSDALLELLNGLADKAAGPTPALAREAEIPGRRTPDAQRRLALAAMTSDRPPT